MLIRAAILSDLEAIWEIERVAFGSEIYPRFFFRQAYDLWGDLLLVAELPSAELAGYILGGVSTRKDEAWLLSVAVQSEHRGRGIAVHLIRNLLDHLAAHSVREVHLTVHPDKQSAIRSFQRFGFRTVEEDARYFGPTEPRVLMSMVLPSNRHAPA